MNAKQRRTARRAGQYKYLPGDFQRERAEKLLSLWEAEQRRKRARRVAAVIAISLGAAAAISLMSGCTFRDAYGVALIAFLYLTMIFAVALAVVRG